MRNKPIYMIYITSTGEKNIIPELESAFNYFHENFTYLINRHAPLKKFRVKDGNNV